MLIACLLLDGSLAALLRPRVSPRAERAVMGVSDRMATDGVLYDEWGKDGLRILNQTHKLLSEGMEQGISRYDIVLTVAQRAKENALQMSEEEEAYPSGGMGPKVKPARSEVVIALDELNEELIETGQLPELLVFDDEEDENDHAEEIRTKAMAKTTAKATKPTPQTVTRFRGQPEHLSDGSEALLSDDDSRQISVDNDALLGGKQDSQRLSVEDDALVGGESVLTNDVVADDLLFDDNSPVEIGADPSALVEEDFDEFNDVLGNQDNELVGQVTEMVGKALEEDWSGRATDPPSASKDKEELGDDLFTELFGGVNSASQSIESGGMHPGDRG
ncbi:MAG: hypothetical protein SGPRY_014705 [Prymnesium sp.]